MLRNYFKVAWRNALKSKGYTILNVVGLAIGIASVILIFVYVLDETSYDTIHPAPKLTFGLGEVLTNDQGEKSTLPVAPTQWTKLMKEQIPEVNEILRFVAFGYPFNMKNPENDNVLLTHDGEVLMVEKTYPEVLYLNLLQGNKATIFEQNNAVVISESAAKRLFGDINVIGRTIELKHVYVSNEYVGLKVSGVMKDYPSNSHLKPDYLIPIDFLNTFFQNNMNISVNEFLSNFKAYAPSYVLFKDGTNIAKVENTLNRILDENLGEEAKMHEPFLRNVADFHYDKDVDWTWWDGKYSFDYVIIFACIGLIILIVACINYMNLTTARSVKRSKEVGVRKSLGGNRLSLMTQFFQESFLLSFVALILALLLAILSLSIFNDISEKHFTISSFFRPKILFGLLGIWVIVALIAGSYPAVFLSKFRPVEVLKGDVSIGKGPTRFRKLLVIFQLTASVLLIVCTGVILRQMDMLQKSKLYEQADQIVSIRFGGIAPTERYSVIKNEILSDPEIQDVTLAIHLPQREGFAPLNVSLNFPELNGAQIYNWSQINGDFNFPEMFDMEFVAGRGFSQGSSSDSTNYIMNETAVRNLNKTPNEVLGLSVMDTVTKQRGNVIGVVKDFSFESIHDYIKPMVIQGKPHPENQILYVKIPADKIQDKLSLLENKWKRIFPDVGFDYWFLSDEFGRMYSTEKKMSGLVQFFSILAIFISCLGLYGLASYIAEQKTKEIGVRKILGASLAEILKILVSDFILMIGIACLVAFPIGYWLMDNWLTNFAYNVGISWIIFVVTAIVILMLTLITVSYETLKAAMSQPVKSLRHE
ncbi:MAG: ABC transporter permease [Allomuricauda sp.]